jgi:hypothetical protein
LNGPGGCNDNGINQLKEIYSYEIQSYEIQSKLRFSFINGDSRGMDNGFWLYRGIIDLAYVVTGPAKAELASVKQRPCPDIKAWALQLISACAVNRQFMKTDCVPKGVLPF